MNLIIKAETPGYTFTQTVKGHNSLPDDLQSGRSQRKLSMGLLTLPAIS